MDAQSLDSQIKSVLYESIKILFPTNSNPSTIIKRHVWRDRNYVGEKDGKVVAWHGWSANLVSIDFRYRAIFIDVVDNTLPPTKRVELFGSAFETAIADLSQFLVMFVLDFPTNSASAIQEQGFIPRHLPRALHACAIVGIDEFLACSSFHWAARVARLIMLQRFLSIHRKPFDSNEVPLQNLLYRTGYLHSYIVREGLELYRLSKPRSSGHFGHDLHAVVRNPFIDHQDPFSVGIELYTGSMGYHIDTIPQYVNKFGLRGMIIIAKDDPFPNLSQVSSKFFRPVYKTLKLSDMGDTSLTGIHYLPLQKIVSELVEYRDELDALLPQVRHSSN